MILPILGEKWFNSVIKTEVKSSVDENTNTGDKETSI